MPIPAAPKKLIAYLPNGKAVCYDHHLRVCPLCCVDYAYMDDEESDDDDDDDDEDDEDDEQQEEDLDSADGDEAEDDDYLNMPTSAEDDRVFVLGTGENRFMPQWDEQILGPANTYKLEKDYVNPPKPLPLSTLKLHQCTTCNLTWLVGQVGEAAAKGHPSHHAYSQVYAGTRRSLVVFVDGACSSNGAMDAKGGVGVHFGSASKYNLSEGLTLQGKATNQRAELHAIARALELVREKVMPQRKLEVRAAVSGRDAEGIRDLVHTRLIITTDSSFAVEGMCSHFKGWTYNGAKDALVNKKKKVLENSDGFLRIKREVDALSMIGVRVVYYHVGREENLEADRLAKAAITSA
jgi:ribonuclease HI